MTIASTAGRWQQQQAHILQGTYTAGWQAGASAYHSQPPTAGSAPVAAVLAPAPAGMAVALTPALTQIARIAAGVAQAPNKTARITGAVSRVPGSEVR